ncbi:uncharacterized protein CELE_C16C8.26 [Caenorhabditis elegans]|uniref:Secreted protein n=1 Tax=Caenorhabditis elegans TaxID=6239 RepID=A0A5S9MQL1_CAEEL|nr:Secreted protein [Caenorhabditis elegans]CAA0059142.1 Secreted protein [Caenorhabditis elegans]
MIFLFIFLVVLTNGHPGPIPPPKVCAEIFFNNFTKAVNTKEPWLDMLKFFSTKFLSTPENVKIFEHIPAEISGYTYTLEYTNYQIFMEPGKNIHGLNVTLVYRGPHPSYTRKRFDVILENLDPNPQTQPDWWRIRSWMRNRNGPPPVQNRKFVMVTPSPKHFFSNIFPKLLESFKIFSS